MNSIKKIAAKTFDVLEIYIPMIMFFLVFTFYIIMIVNRYMLYGKLGIYFELCQIAFVWCSILAASYGGRSDKHVVFAIVYDKCSEKTQLVFRLIGNLINVATFVILLPFSYEAISFLAIKKSDQIGIPFNIIYAPFLVFIILTIIYYLNWLIKDIKFCINSRRGSDKK